MSKSRNEFYAVSSKNGMMKNGMMKRRMEKQQKIEAYSMINETGKRPKEGSPSKMVYRNSEKGKK